MEAPAVNQLSPEDQAIVDSVEPSLAMGAFLKSWWEETQASNNFAERFELVRVFNRPDVSFGFFDQVRIGDEVMDVMGDIQDMLYDRPKGEAPNWLDEVREFVLRYFLR